MFILIMGVTGSGKTTIGTRLAQAIGWPFYDADEFHPPANIAKMAAGHPLTDEDRWPWLETLQNLIAERSARGEHGVLACSALKETYRNRLAAATSLSVVYLQAAPDLVHARLAARRGHYMPQRLIESQFHTLQAPAQALHIPAAWPPDEIVAFIQAQLKL